MIDITQRQDSGHAEQTPRRMSDLRPEHQSMPLDLPEVVEFDPTV
jgi:hypothetical protein